MPRVVKPNTKEKVMNNDERKKIAKEILAWAEANYEDGGCWICNKNIEHTFNTLEEAQEYCQLLNGLNKEVNSW